MGVPTIYVLSNKKKTITSFHLKIIIFKAVKNCSILHGRDFVMKHSNMSHLCIEMNMVKYHIDLFCCHKVSQSYVNISNLL